MPTRPNILLVNADQIGAHHLGCYGDTTGATPNLDALAARGVRFSRAYCASPVCICARASMYSGQYPHTHGKVAHLRMPLEPRPPLLPEVLAASGYATGLVGKTHFYPPSDPIGCEIAHITIDSHLAYELVPHDAYVRFLQEQGVLEEIGLTEFTPEACTAKAPLIRSLPERLHRATWTGDTACGVLSRFAADDRPFFLYCSFVEPHGPEPCPPEYEDKFAGKIREPITRSNELDAKPPIQRLVRDRGNEVLEGTYGSDHAALRRRFYGLVNLVDHNIGKILEELDQLGLREDTMVFFLTDHGELLGDHGMYQKCLFYDSCARVPLLVAGPEAAGDRVCEALVSQVDLMPTILELCGAAKDDLLLDGSSFADLLAHPERPGRPAVYSELYQNQFIPEGTLCNTKMIRTGRWKYVYYTDGPCDELYDMEADPHELTNLARSPEHGGTVRELRDRLLHWLAESEANRIHPAADNHYMTPRWDPTKDEQQTARAEDDCP